MCLLCAVFTHLLSEQSRKLSSSHNSACKIIRFWFLFFFPCLVQCLLQHSVLKLFRCAPGAELSGEWEGWRALALGVCSIPGGLPAQGDFCSLRGAEAMSLKSQEVNRDTNRKGQVIRGVAWTVSLYFTLPITSPAFSSPGLFYFLLRQEGLQPQGLALPWRLQAAGALERAARLLLGVSGALGCYEHKWQHAGVTLWGCLASVVWRSDCFGHTCLFAFFTCE